MFKQISSCPRFWCFWCESRVFFRSECAGSEEWPHTDYVQSTWPSRAPLSSTTQTRHSTYYPSHINQNSGPVPGSEYEWGQADRVSYWQNSQSAQYTIHSKDYLQSLQPEQESWFPHHSHHNPYWSHEQIYIIQTTNIIGKHLKLTHIEHLPLVRVHGSELSTIANKSWGNHQASLPVGFPPTFHLLTYSPDQHISLYFWGDKLPHTQKHSFGSQQL